MYPRPYLGNFLEYLFARDPTSPNTSAVTLESSSNARAEGGKLETRGDDGRGYEVFVWSSAQPHNVRTMVETAFGPRWIEGVYNAEKGNKEDAGRLEGEGRLLGVWARDMMDLNPHDYGEFYDWFLLLFLTPSFGIVAVTFLWKS